MPDEYDYVALLTKTIRALRDMDEHFTLLLKDLDKARARSFAPSPAATTVHAQFKELSRLRDIFEKLQKNYSDASRDLRATRALAAEPGACFAQFAVKIEKGVRELHRRARKVELHAVSVPRLLWCRDCCGCADFSLTG